MLKSAHDNLGETIDTPNRRLRQRTFRSTIHHVWLRLDRATVWHGVRRGVGA
jgi:hypothetical protein